MEQVLGTPHAALRGAVLRLEGYTARGPTPVWIRELPGTFVPVIIDLDTGWTVVDPRYPDRADHLGSFVAGLTDGPVLVEHPGYACCLQVDLAPLAARRILGVPLSEITNRSVALDDVVGRWGRELVERVGAVADWEDRFAVVNQMLAVRMAESAPPDPALEWPLDRLAASDGSASIGGLADELEWSHRRLIARFRDAVGMPPKRIARIVRFERLVALVESERELDWASAAAKCGFADQAHLAREVREFSGLTPGALHTERINFVQDLATAAA